jgi:hypothetical protein
MPETPLPISPLSLLDLSRKAEGSPVAYSEIAVNKKDLTSRS